MWRYRTKPKTLSLSKAMFFSNSLLYCSNAMEAPFLPSLLLQPDIKKEQRALHSLSWETQQSSAVRLGPRQPQKVTWEAVTELYAQNKTFSTSLHGFRLAVTGDYPDQDMGCLKALLRCLSPNTACLFWLPRSSLYKKSNYSRLNMASDYFWTLTITRAFPLQHLALSQSLQD